MNVNNEAMPRAKTPELSPGLAAVNVTTRPALCRGPFRPGAAATLALGRKELPSDRGLGAAPRASEASEAVLQSNQRNRWRRRRRASHDTPVPSSVFDSAGRRPPPAGSCLGRRTELCRRDDVIAAAAPRAAEAAVRSNRRGRWRKRRRDLHDPPGAQVGCLLGREPPPAASCPWAKYAR